MKLISTNSKEKLLKGKSYPIGAETISKALEGVPQYNEIELYFYIQDEFWASKYNKKIKNEGVIKIITAECSAPFYDWRINLYSIPSEHKSTVSKSVVSEILPQLQKLLFKFPAEEEFPNFLVSYCLQTKAVKIGS